MRYHLAQSPDLRYGEPVAPRVCNNRRIPNRTPVRVVTAARFTCTPALAFGAADPFATLARAVARAIEMLDNTIGELVNGRAAVCAGQPPAFPLFGDMTLEWLNRLGVCTDDIRVWTAGTFVNRSVAEVIRRLVRARNLIASNHLRYICGSTHCTDGTWALVFPFDAAGDCLPGTPPLVIRLCRRFWVRNPDVTADVHAEFQAQTIIHEASHLTHCTGDRRGTTIGVAECLTQLVAATNGSPLDPLFVDLCGRSTRCGPVAAGAVHGFGAAPVHKRVARTVFHPERAVRPRGRLVGRAAQRAAAAR
ncbi:MAG TPA: M35 family metallo-endopeptidase [Pyrinomonadaceae bacterium]|nr:M35 family metallo-endopeptidase [Pyrinomonadaceae bacterium]